MVSNASEIVTARQRTRRRNALRRLLAEPLGVIGLVLVLAVLLVAIFAPLVALHSPIALAPINRFLPPSEEHLLGTDHLGRDLFARVVYGSRIALSVSVIAVPAFVIAVYALLIFSIWLRWFPAIGAGDGVLDGAYHLVLPSLALGLGWVGYIARMLRASILEVQGENHVRTARAFGLSENKVIFDYVLRIAVLPTLTVLGIGIGQLLSGAVFAEIVFARPGIGKLVYDAILTRNYPIVSGTVLVTTFFFVLVNVLADLMIAWLDPRVRHGLQR